MHYLHSVLVTPSRRFKRALFPKNQSLKIENYVAMLPCCHRHLRIYIDCLMVHTPCLVCFISTVNGHCNKKKKKEEAYPWKASTSSGHTTNLNQSILRLLISMHAANWKK